MLHYAADYAVSRWAEGCSVTTNHASLPFKKLIILRAVCGGRNTVQQISGALSH